MKMENEKDILIVVDMQNGFLRKNHLDRLTKKIESLLFMKVFDVVIATRYTNGDNSIYEKLLNWKGLKSEEATQLNSTVKYHANCIVAKTIYSCVNTDFIKKLCQLNNGEYPNKVFIVGVDTDCGVLKIAVDLFEHNIRPIVLTNYCGSNGGENSHRVGITCMQRLIGGSQVVDRKIVSKQDLKVDEPRELNEVFKIIRDFKIRIEQYLDITTTIRIKKETDMMEDYYVCIMTPKDERDSIFAAYIGREFEKLVFEDGTYVKFIIEGDWL